MHWRQYQELQKVVEIGDRFISYVDRGAGAPLVLLHGMPVWGYVWHRLLPGLERERRVLVPDLPGFGYSDRSDRFDRSLARQADMIAAWMRALGLEKADFAGHELGGGVALRLAAFHPELVGRLCLMSSVCYDSWPIGALAVFARPEAARGLSVGAAQKCLRALLRRGFVRSDEALIEGLLAPFSTEEGKLSLIRDAAALDANQTMELVGRLPALKAESLVLWGEEDSLQPERYGRRLAWDLPKARFVVIPGAGHFVFVDRPEETAAALEGLLIPAPTS